MAPFRFSGWGSFKGQWHVSKDLKAEMRTSGQRKDVRKNIAD